MKKITLSLFLVILFATQIAMAQTIEPAHPVPQESKVTFGFFEGTVAAGYVDKGGFLNFTGPNVSFTSGKSKLLLGMLPSLRFKEDKSQVKNSFVMPTLGIGLTYSYKKLALQIPLYYNAKTTTADGKWNVGIGVGIKLK
ncbi:hypothetical protein GGR22_003155 [Flavobacterium gossypii]|uniref:Outer membrane protein beta-barrel domain-containing protein n=1 Tax=Flavobacterium gossypii TaxID=1646119 RepID=A0ABR6DU58_9FLAO|nr:hypothetical protein [Flavobacterium gossypii]MBA9074978.1 hypothetical protein [Flavobacterium gossypii]